jgi:hypothetical protein
MWIVGDSHSLSHLHAFGSNIRRSYRASCSQKEIIFRLFHSSNKPLMSTPPAKAGGFGLRLKAGSIGHSAD